METRDIKLRDYIAAACNANDLPLEIFYNALNSVNPDDLTETEIEQHIIWCLENVDDGD